VGSGCGGAVPNIQLGEKIVRSDPAGVVACVAVEISTATFEMTNDMGIIVSNAIFGDGAAAAVITNSAHGLALEETASAFFPETREYVRFVHRGGRLHNKLDPQLPRVIRQTVPPFMRDLLARRRIESGDVRHWALHPGGERILNAIQEELQLSPDALNATRDILARYGNMSSPSVLFVLEQLMAGGMDKNAWCMMAAYGAGMSVHGYLLKNL
jgi:predicted naringenin-chalcone synthase